METLAALGRHIADCGFQLHDRGASPLEPSLVRVERRAVPFKMGLEFDTFESVPTDGDGDRLGLFSVGGNRWERGIHLFADRIMPTAVENRLLPAHLAAHVFWHEVTHCHLHCRAQRGPLPDFFAAVDIEEVGCEVLATMALRHGHYAPLKLPTVCLPDQIWKVTRWRQRTPIYPYSWFPIAMAAAEVVGPQAFLNYVLAVRDAQDGGEHGPNVNVVEDAVALLTGSISIAQAVRLIELTPQHRFRQRAALEFSFPVFVWGLPK